MWKSITGYESLYEVDDSGRVRSLDHTVIDSNGIRRCRRGRVLKWTYSHGYAYVCLSKNGKVKRHRVHRLVAEAFIGPCPDGLQVCHKDGDRLNNQLSNLRYGTSLQNHRDRFSHGTVPRGSDVVTSKLTAGDVSAIKASNSTYTSLARKYGVTRQNISQIKKGLSWAHTSGD